MRPHRSLVAGALALTVSLTGTPAYAAATSSDVGAGSHISHPVQTMHALSRYSGQDLYRGLFLGVGPVAARYPQLVAYQSGQALAASDADLLVHAVQKSDPQVFDRLATAVHSGNRYRIQAGVQDVATATVKAVQGLPSSAVLPTMRGVYRFAIAVIDVAVFAIAVAVVFIAAKDDDQGLTLEQWVDHIARAES